MTWFRIDSSHHRRQAASVELAFCSAFNRRVSFNVSIFSLITFEKIFFLAHTERVATEHRLPGIFSPFMHFSAGWCGEIICKKSCWLWRLKGSKTSMLFLSCERLDCSVLRWEERLMPSAVFTTVLLTQPVSVCKPFPKSSILKVNGPGNKKRERKVHLNFKARNPRKDSVYGQWKK